MFGLKWLVDHGALPKDRLPEYYSSYVAGIFRTLCVSEPAKPTPRRDDGVQLSAEKTARWRWSMAATSSTTHASPVLAQLCKRLLEMEDAGDRTGAEAWFMKV